MTGPITWWRRREQQIGEARVREAKVRGALLTARTLRYAGRHEEALAVLDEAHKVLGGNP